MTAPPSPRCKAPAVVGHSRPLSLSLILEIFLSGQRRWSTRPWDADTLESSRIALEDAMGVRATQDGSRLSSRVRRSARRGGRCVTNCALSNRLDAIRDALYI